MRRSGKLWLVVLAALSGFGVGVLGSENTFGRLRPEVSAQPLVYSVEVRDEDGALLASPLLVGEDDGAVHLDLSQAPTDEEPATPALQMSLDLAPRLSGPEVVCLGFKLSLDDGQTQRGILHEGRVALRLGEKQSVELSQHGEKLQLQLTVARAGTKAFEALLRARKGARPLT